MNSKVTEYVEQLVHYKLEHNGEMIKYIQEEAMDEVVDLHDVGEAILSVTNDIIRHIDVSQAVMEARLRAIVGYLGEETKNKIYKEFEERGDELFE